MNPALAIYHLWISNPSFLEWMGYNYLGYPATLNDIDCDSFIEWMNYIEEIEDFVLEGTGDPSDPPIGMFGN